MQVDFNNIIDEFVQTKNLGKLEQLTKLDKERISKLTPNDLGELSIQISQYGIEVQKLYNEEISRCNWLDGNIKIIIVNDLKQSKAYHYEEKKLQAISNNEYAQKLYRLQLETKVKVDYLSFMAHRLEFYAKMLTELQQVRRYQWKHAN